MTDGDNRAMGSTLILRTSAMFLLPLQLLFSLFLLLRGHDEPGGGFIAGLVAAGALVLYLFAHGVQSTRTLLRLDPRDLLGFGLLLALVSTLPALLRGEPPLTAQWWTLQLGDDNPVKLSTVLLFDLGVYFSVLGTVLTIVVSLAEVED